MTRQLLGFVAIRLLMVALALSTSPWAAAWATPKTESAQAIDRIAMPAQTHFAEPLIAMGPTTASENRALARALARYEQRKEVDDLSALTGFVAQKPHSGWGVALLLNLGLSYKHYGYLSRALDAWEMAWREGKAATGPYRKALVDRTFAELVLLHAQLGHGERVAALLDEIGDRPVSGPATEFVQIARETLWVMQNDPKHLFLCGPMALKALMLANAATQEAVQFLNRYRAGPLGVSLAEVARLAGEAKVPYVPVFRRPDQPVPVPSIVHWKIGHFAAILGQENGRFRVKDPVLGVQEQWVTPAAIAAEASGYFLAPAEKASETGWRAVGAEEAGLIWGTGPTTGPDPNDPGPPADPPPDCEGMCGYNIAELGVAVTLMDRPVGYTPPIGPSAKITIAYNQREASQPAVFNFFNVSPKWTLNRLTYIADDPTSPGTNVMRYRPGGGAWLYSGYNTATGAFTAEEADASVLVLSSQSPVTYQRFLQNGSVEIYAQSDGSASYPRNVFLTQIIDPQGNALTLNYSTGGGQVKLTSLTDATGRKTTFTYGLGSAPLLITQITDPFGRSATLTYDSSGRLSSITDVLGLTSTVTYDASSEINSLTTPYGTTQFAYAGTGNTRSVQVTDPLGYKEREESLQPAPGPFSDPVAPNMPTFNQYLTYRDSFHWDKHEYGLAGCTAVGGCNYSSARMTHFHHYSQNANIEWHSIESIKQPLETRIWFDYPGQTNGYNHLSGTYDKPTLIGRLVDAHTTQLSQRSYNAFGNPTQLIDPASRTTDLAYAANLIDLQQVQQITQSGAQITASYTYNTQHRPLTYTDAAGQVTQYAYNSAGQLTRLTLPTGLVWNFAYDSLGRLTQITNPNAASQTSYTYDAFDRVATATDSEGYTLAYAYDAADRVIQITYPDGTTRKYAYNRLDLASVTDRQGRVDSYSYDADRRLISATDPLGNTTKYAYWENGKLKSLTDPNGNVTSWDIDLQGRAAVKHYADGSQVLYGYDTTGRLNSVRDALGQFKKYAYTTDDRLARIDHTYLVNPTPSVAFSYDPDFPRLVAMNDGTGATSYSYVPVGSLGALKLQMESAPTGAISYQYDALGRVVGRTVSGVTETFQYDALNRLTGHIDPLGQFALSYLGQTRQIAGRTQTSSQNYAAQTNWSYLANSGDHRLAAINNTAMRQFQYTTTPEDLITAIVEQSQSASQNWSYGYDNANRLTSANYSTGLAYGITLDPDGNITTFQGKSQQLTFMYNDLNELVSETAQQRSMLHDIFSTVNATYDANGNLLSDGQRSYTWDAENRLIGISYGGQLGQATQFAYDGFGRRVVITESMTNQQPATTIYQWCGSHICQDKSSATAALRLYYDEGEVVVPTGAQLYYGPDQIGSARNFALVTTQGTTVQRYDFDPFGNALTSPGSAPMPDFRFAGMFYHAISGLYLTQYRAYDPRTARWLSRDPLGETRDPGPTGKGLLSVSLFSNILGSPPVPMQMLAYVAGRGADVYSASRLISNPMWAGIGKNLFLYASADPVNMIDPSGLQSANDQSGNDMSSFLNPTGTDTSSAGDDQGVFVPGINTSSYCYPGGQSDAPSLPTNESGSANGPNGSNGSTTGPPPAGPSTFGGWH